MDDLEHWLHAAMAAAAQDPPAGLLERIWRRRRLRLRRVGAGCAATLAAVALAAPAAVHHAQRLSAGSGLVAPAVSSPSRSSPPPAAASGTLLRDCATNNNGTMDNNWKARSLQVGSLWIVGGREAGVWPSSRRLAAGRLTAVVKRLVAVSNGSTVVLIAAPAARGRIRFLAPTDFGSGSLRGPWSGMTFVGCPAYAVAPGLPEGWAAGLTLFWLNYRTNLTRCIPLEVRFPPSGRPVTITLSVTGGTCPA